MLNIELPARFFNEQQQVLSKMASVPGSMNLLHADLLAKNVQ